MNNFKKQGNSIVIQSVNENVTPPPIKNSKAIFDGLFFTFINIFMSKRYSGKSFKDSSVKKKPKLSFKEKRKLKREKQKNRSN